MNATPDPLAYPESQVLINKLGITNAEQLRKTEYAVANARLRELKASPIQGNFDRAHLKQIHHFLLRDIYDWAGKTRDEVYTKDNLFTKGSTLFSLQKEIAKDADTLFGQLAKDGFLRGHEGNKNAFVAKLTDLYVGMNKIHPFREGNGRATQEFISQLAKQAGYEIDYSKVDRVRWNASARDSAQGKPESMRAVFDDIASPARAVAFDKLPAAEALKKHPELGGAFLALVQAKRYAIEYYSTPEDRTRFMQHNFSKLSNELHKGGGFTPQIQDRARTQIAGEQDR